MKSGKLTLDSYYLLYVLPVSSVPSGPRSHQFPPGVLCPLLGLSLSCQCCTSKSPGAQCSAITLLRPSAEFTLSWTCKGSATRHLPSASTSPTAHPFQTHSTFQTHQAHYLPLWNFPSLSSLIPSLLSSS